MGQDGSQHRVHIIAILLSGGIGEIGVEGLRFKLGNLGILGGRFAEQSFAVELLNKCTSSLAFGVNGCAGFTTLTLEVAVGLAATGVNGTLGLAAAILLTGHDIESIAQALNFVLVSSGELGDDVVFLRNLSLEASSEDSSLGAGLTLRKLGADILKRGDGAAETFAELAAEVGNLHELVTANGIDVRAHGGQRIHDVLIGSIVAAGIATAVIVPVTVTAPRRADSAADGAADKGAAPITATIVTVDIERRLETFHEVPHFVIG